jgi:exo-beta-1,3-glucanase (GH17 family)
MCSVDRRAIAIRGRTRLMTVGLALALMVTFPTSVGAVVNPIAMVSAATGSCRSSSPVDLPLSGLAYGPYHVGQGPDVSVFPSAAEVAADMPTLACLTKDIRIYSSLGPAEDVIRAATAESLSVNLGIWLGRNAKTNESEIATGIRLASNHSVRTLTVGNEVLLRKDLTEKQLRTVLQRVRAGVGKLDHKVEVTTADVDGQWLAHPTLARDVDLVTVHLYPFWRKIAITQAISTLAAEYAKIRTAFPGKQVLIGETGWPSAGPAKGAAVPNDANQARYFRDFVKWAGQQSPRVRYFYFDAFDEGWKTAEAGVGTHWGLYGLDGSLKPDLRNLLPAAASATVDERANRDVYVGGLETGFGLGVDSFSHKRTGVTARLGTLQLSYPAGEQWGSVFITAGESAPAGKRGSFDARRYSSLLVDLRTAVAGQCARLGIKDKTQPDNGSEMTLRQCPGTEWSTVALPLNAFAGVDRAYLYVALEIVFQGNKGQTFYLRNLRFSPMQVPALPVPASEPMPFTVYSDDYSPGNHFFPSGFMGDYTQVSLRQDSTDQPHSSPTCIMVGYTASTVTGAGWAGVYWQDPANNWGHTLGLTGYNLQRASQLSFWARGATGGETVEFMAGAIANENGDSLQPAVSRQLTLTQSWQQVTIDLTGRDLSHIVGGYAWVARRSDNPHGATFFLDDISYS